MKKPDKVLVQRVGLYLTIAIAGLALLLGAYCLIALRSVLAAIQNLWIALVFALIASVATAVRDHRADAE
ncbi:hypothetical protein [Glutamicibacter sp.]|uniref:hypothetical protein n=1 Tax=Glutamicibacter sp. TaxID=1931995 RepID=UPI002FE38FE8